MIVIPSRTKGDSTFRKVLALPIMPVIPDTGAITNGDTAFSFSEDARTIVSAALALRARLICAFFEVADREAAAGMDSGYAP